MGLGDELNGFGDRLKNIALFQPLFDLQNNRKYSELDPLSLGFAILLYILDNMLIGREPCDHQAISHYLKRLVARNYDKHLTDEESLEMTYTFLDGLRNNGRPFEFEYKDLETGEDLPCKFALIEVASYEIRGKMRFKLTDAGLDLLFKTKEIYKELRISISQLYLRQQIEKGVFQEALHTVDDLYVQVKDVQGKLERIKQQVLRNVSGVSISSYINLMDEVHEQFQREKTVFSSLQTLLLETQDTYRFRELSVRERESFDQLIRVSTLLDKVINEHNALFTRKMNLSALLEEAMLDSLANTFRTQINFEREFLDQVLLENTPLDHLRQVIHPLLTARKSRSFNILRVLEPQRVSVEGDEAAVSQEGPDELQLELLAEREKAIKAQRDRRVLRYLSLILTPIKDRTHWTLEEVLADLEVEEYARLISEVEFYAFLVQVHQMERIPLKIEDEIRDKIIDSDSGNLGYLLLKFLDQYPGLQAPKGVEVIAGEEEIRLANGSVITNYHYQISSEERGDSV